MKRRLSPLELIELAKTHMDPFGSYPVPNDEEAAYAFLKAMYKERIMRNSDGTFTFEDEVDA